MRRLSLLLALPFAMVFDLAVGVLTAGYIFGILLAVKDITLQSARIIDGLLEK